MLSTRAFGLSISFESVRRSIYRTTAQPRSKRSHDTIRGEERTYLKLRVNQGDQVPAGNVTTWSASEASLTDGSGKSLTVLRPLQRGTHQLVAPFKGEPDRDRPQVAEHR